MQIYTDFENVYVDIGDKKNPELYDIEGISWRAEQEPANDRVQAGYALLRRFWEQQSSSFLVAAANSRK